MAYMESRPANRKVRHHLTPASKPGAPGPIMIVQGNLQTDRHMPAISGTGQGQDHRTASAEQRCGPTIEYGGLTPDPGSRARDAASNWTPFPTRMTTSRCTKEWAWTSLLTTSLLTLISQLTSCANNRFVRWEFIAGAPARSHLFDVERRLVREPCGRARRHA